MNGATCEGGAGTENVGGVLFKADGPPAFWQLVLCIVYVSSDNSNESILVGSYRIYRYTQRMITNYAILKRRWAPCGLH